MSGAPGMTCSSPKSGVKQIRPRGAAGVGTGAVGAALSDGTSSDAGVVGTKTDVASDVPRSLEFDLDRPTPRRANIDRYGLRSGMADIAMSFRSFWTRRLTTLELNSKVS